ncbi:flagellar hook-basal body complex protein FliE [Stieleria varia]|uniref:Flagellar hook-basal body complex protein FliE n=1 Tax=Stieleria varia TaxID=2528005 RepID=A0A5C6ARP3_9BACT|nr:flagellar hook-basal body complex protein FliE [Stieleria varia]TWU02171.1 flagellar hook-basal body protein FliE [Stieleria varia]
MSPAPLPHINGSANVAPPSSPASAKPANTGDVSFGDLLSKVNDDQISSDAAINDLVTGKNDDVQQVVMQVVKSEMSFQLFMEVRNQLIESYNELMRMQF